MKNKRIRLSGPVVLLILSAAFTLFYSCKDDNASSGGTPVITNVYQLDTIKRHRDSLFTAAEPNVLLVINGQNLAGVTKAYFNEFETSFNTNYNTNTTLIIRVPAQAPTDSTADNMIRLVTKHGEATFAFKIVAKPAIYSFDKYAFGAGRGDITFKGKNFADMTNVTGFREKDSPTDIVKDSVVCEIISKTADKLVIRIPANTISRLTLHFTNSSGTTKGTDAFTNADLAFKFFTERFGSFTTSDGAATWNGDSWANPVTVTTDFAFAGDTSVSISLNQGGWSWFGFTDWYPQYVYDSTVYKYVTFAIKGGADDMPLWITSEVTKADGGGVDKFAAQNEFQVYSGVWNYYRFAIADLDFLYNGKSVPRIGFRPKGPDKPEVLYVDDFMLVK